MNPVDRRQFLRIAGVSLGAGALYQVAAPAFGEGGRLMRALGKKNGETPTPFSFVQFSDTHVGFSGPAGSARDASLRAGGRDGQCPAAAAGPRPLLRRPHARQRKPGGAREPHAAISGDRRPASRTDRPMRSGRARRGPRRGQVVPGDARRDVLFVRSPRSPLRRARQRLAGKAPGRPGPAGVAPEGPRALSENRADRRLHAPAALRPRAPTGSGSRATATRCSTRSRPTKT